MKRKAGFLSKATLASVVLMLVLVSVVYAATNVDTFDAGVHDLAADNYTNPPASQYASSVTDPSGVIGGERDAQVQWIDGDTDKVYLKIDVGGSGGSNRLAYTSGDGMTGKATVIWDGNDNDADNLDPDGLGTTNLTSGGNDGFLAKVIFDDLEADLTFTVYEYDPTTDWSYSTIRLPGGVGSGQRMDVFFPFGSFQTGGGGGADFSDVGSILLEVDGTVEAGVDVSIDLVEATSVREYGDLPDSGSVVYGSAILNATHIPQGLRLGVNVDAETDDNPSTTATGDDSQGTPDDEDGVLRDMSNMWTYDSSVDLRITVNGCSGTCYFNGWIDWNNDGDFADAGEQVFDDNSISDGNNQTRSLTVPSSGGEFEEGDDLYSRFRICTATGTCDTPTATGVVNGEIEDYWWEFKPNAVTFSGLSAQSGPVFGVVVALGLVGLLAVGALVVVRRRA